MKKFIVILILLLSLTGCSKEESKADTNSEIVETIQVEEIRIEEITIE